MFRIWGILFFYLSSTRRIVLSSYELDPLNSLLPPEGAIKVTGAPSGGGIVISEVHYHEAVFDVRPENAGWDMTADQINALAAGSLGLHLETSQKVLGIKNIAAARKQVVLHAGFGPKVEYNGKRFSAAVNHYVRSDVLSLRETVSPKINVPLYIVEAIEAFGDPARLSAIAASNNMNRFRLEKELNKWAEPGSHVLFGYAIGALATKSTD